MGRVVRGASCHGASCHGASCPWSELSLGRVVHAASCPCGELSPGRVVVGQVVRGVSGPGTIPSSRNQELCNYAKAVIFLKIKRRYEISR